MLIRTVANVQNFSILRFAFILLAIVLLLVVDLFLPKIMSFLSRRWRVWSDAKEQWKEDDIMSPFLKISLDGRSPRDENSVSPLSPHREN